MKLTFTVDLPKFNKNNAFAESILSEVKDEERQLELTREINAKTTEAHSKVLDTLVEELNLQLEPLGAKFNRTRSTYGGNINGYREPYAIMELGGSSYNWGLKLKPPVIEKFEHSKYTTKLGAYSIEVTRLAGGFVPSCVWVNVDGVDAILDKIRDDVKNHYKTTAKLT